MLGNSPSRSPRLALLVLGMHRSGTSALARVLNLRGLDIGSQLLPASENNRTGFWESRELVELHEELLERLGQGWQSITALPAGWWRKPGMEELRQRFLSYLERDFGNSSAFVIKDPRLCRLLPFWIELLQEFGARTCVVLMLRNPVEVAASLEARKGMSLPADIGLQLWLRYSLDAEHDSRGVPRCLISYDDLLADWEGTLGKISNQLEFEWPRSTSEASPDIAEFLSGSHRHQRLPEDCWQEGVPHLVRETFEVLNELTRNPGADEARHSMDRLRTASEALWQGMAPLLDAYDRRYREDLALGVELTRRVRDVEANLRAREAELSKTKRVLQARDAQIRLLQDRVRQLRGSIHDLQHSVRELQHGLQVSRTENGRLKAELGAMLESTSWRVTAPIRHLSESVQRLRDARVRSLAGLGLEASEIPDFLELRESGLFDADFYLDAYPEARDSGLNPLHHFLRTGAQKGFRPNALFDPAWYEATYPDVQEMGINPLLHYLRHGAAEGRDPGPGFSTMAYLSLHPELQQDGVNPLAHCLAKGGRIPGVAEVFPAKARTTAGEARSMPGHSGQPHLPRRLFQDFSGYERNSIFLVTLEAPFSEEAKRVLGYMSGLRRYLSLRFEQAPSVDLVSIIMPTYNRADCIGKAVESALAQTHAEFELIVVDDGGTDATEDVIKSYDDPRIRYFRYEANRGAARARNFGLDQARGRFITYLDSDNTMEPDFLRIMLGVVQSSPDIEMAYCAQKILRGAETESGTEVESIRFAAFSRSLLENRNYIDLGVLLHRRSMLDRVGRFSEEMQRLMDWEFLLRATEERAPTAVACVLSNYLRGAADNRITSSACYFSALTYVDEYLATQRIANDLGDDGIAGLDRMYSPLFCPEPSRARAVSIVIPSYECLEFLKLCVAAIERFTPQTYELIVVDNASQAPVLAFLSEKANQGALRLIRNETNLGFTHAVNQGIAAANAENDVVLLNNDAVVTRGWLGALQKVTEDLPDAGLVVPRQVLLANTPTMELHNPACDREREMDVNLSLHHDNVLRSGLGDGSGCFELSFAPFFCVYIPRRTVESVGVLDVENGPHYRSDRLYCESVRRILGQRIIYTPHSKVYHFLQQSTGALKTTDQSRFEALFVRNEWPGDPSPVEPDTRLA